MTIKRPAKTYNFLYQVTNKINHKIYIGVHQTEDLEDGYLGSGKAIVNAVKKYGPENFERVILEFFDNTNDMFAAETRVVTREFIKDPNNYNIAEGGKGGYKGQEVYSCPIRSAKLSAVNKGVGTAIDKDGNIFRAPLSDPRWETKELVGHTIGKTTVKDLHGKVLQVECNDPRILSGELVGITKGLAMVKDAEGNRYHVSKNDPRILSGELVGITRGHTQTAQSNLKRSLTQIGTKKPQPIVTCPTCGKATSKTNIIRWHKKCRESRLDCN